MAEKSNMFEAFNVRYFGPVDGHNVKHLISVLEDLRILTDQNYCM